MKEHRVDRRHDSEPPQPVPDTGSGRSSGSAADDAECLFTVCTPTYNRAHTLPRVYRSLQRQTLRDFEWLIVDDGSTDGTAELVSAWRREASFPIRYLFQENRGKHTAVNRGVREARGTLFLVLDSDDACVPTALERFKHHWESIPEEARPHYSAVTALVRDPEGEVEGTPFPESPMDSDPVEIRRLGVRGEKWGFQRTDVMRRFPYPEIDGERFMAESIVWNRIGREFKTRFVNESLRIRYPTDDSLSSSARFRVESPRSATRYYLEFVELGERLSLTQRLRGSINYVRFALHAGRSPARQWTEFPDGILWMLAFPLGALSYVRDRIVLGGAQDQDAEEGRSSR